MMNSYDVELGDENQDDEDDTEPRAVDTTHCFEWEFFQRVALDDPGLAESDAREITLASGIGTSKNTYWQAQIASQVNKVERPERATSQRTASRFS
jgi:hypothetical protein